MRKVEGPKEGLVKTGTQKIDLNKHGELKTDFPLSEKDEIKQVEEKMRKASKTRH